MEDSDDLKMVTDSKELNGAEDKSESINGIDLKEEEDMVVKEKRPEDSEERLVIKKSMLDHITTSDKVVFMNFKENEGLSKEEKVTVAEELLDRNYGLFLAKYGTHLLKEHLCYFENRSEEESLIVDLHLKTLHKAFERSEKLPKKLHEAVEEDMDIATELTSAKKLKVSIRDKLLDHLSLSTEAHFRSQQIGEADLQQAEKREIAEALLNRSASLFLARFGTHLLEEHLTYFDQLICDDSYEVKYHLGQLRKTHCKPVTQVGIKNRRFEALKKLVEEGSYFCETEMRNRNPLLYEQLVGRFLSADERRERLNNIDTTNITFVNLLLEQMDREKVKKLRKEQEEAEDDALEEEDSNEEMEYEDDDSEEDNKLDKSLWGEELTDGGTSESKPASVKRDNKKMKENKNEEDIPEVSDAEKRILLEEFRSSMFSSFLQGKDTDFDYSQVDYNSDYDDLEAQGLDEEEKYFDEESSQDTVCSKKSEGEDQLEQYMQRLKPEPTTEQLADKINHL